FFSSRRRHTRSKRDWSSDVCSSDLPGLEAGYDRQHTARAIFNVSGLSSGGGENNNEEAAGSTDKNAENPKTGDDSPIVLYTILRSEERRVGNEDRYR